MRSILLLFFCMSAWCLFSCKEKTEYGTTIAFENQLNDSIELKLYPKYEPYSNLKLYKLASNESHGVFWKLGQGELVTSIMKEMFDSVVIRSGDRIIKFTNDTVIGYGINIFIDADCWTSKVITYENETNFSSNPHEDVLYTYTLKIDKLK